MNYSKTTVLNLLLWHEVQIAEARRVRKVRGKILQTGDLHRWIHHNNGRLQARAAEHHIKKAQDTNGIPMKLGKQDAKEAWHEEKIYDRMIWE
jgi:hypothetical protein